MIDAFLKKSFLSFVSLVIPLLLATGCAVAPIPTETPTAVPTAFLCPRSPIQSEIRKDVFPAGEFPIWATSWKDPIPWSNMWKLSLPPYPGRMGRKLWAVDKSVQGNLYVTGKQLDGDGIVLFPTLKTAEFPDDTHILFTKEPADFLVIPSAHESIISSSPPRFADHISLVLYPHPGCYQFTATIAEYTVNIVVEIISTPQFTANRKRSLCLGCGLLSI